MHGETWQDSPCWPDILFSSKKFTENKANQSQIVFWFYVQGTSYAAIFSTLPELAKVYKSDPATVSLMYIPEDVGKIFIAILMGGMYFFLKKNKLSTSIYIAVIRWEVEGADQESILDTVLDATFH